MKQSIPGPEEVNRNAPPDAAEPMAANGWGAEFPETTSQELTENALKLSEERLRLALEAGKMGVWDWNIRTGELKWSDSLEPLHGLASGSFGGTIEDFQKLIHPDDREKAGRAIEQAIRERSGYDMEMRNIRPDGSVHWVAGKGKVFAGEDGKAERMVGICLDVTLRKRSEETSRFLAAASAELAVLVDFDSTLRKVAALAVPSFADWATVDIVEANGTLRRVAVAHADPLKVELAHEIHRRFPPDPAAAGGIWNILRTGRPELVPEITDEMLSQSIRDMEHLQILRDLGLKSYLGVPLKVRGKTLGVLSFIGAESGHLYDEQDLAVAKDVVGRAAIAIENAELYRQLRDADRRKDEFLATLAHELRNPLAPLRNALQILKMGPSDRETTREVHAMMGRQVDQLVRLVDDLLDVSRVMRGKIELRKEKIELAAIVARAVETSQPLIEMQQHALEIRVPPDGLAVVADPVRLAQVVANLLTNAARYTPPHGRILVEAARQDGMAVLQVKDNNGIGIAPEMLDQVFEVFVQADNASTKAQGGLGIGLTLVKNLVEMHGGTVEARSGGGDGGAEFIVRLPLAGGKDRERMEGEAGVSSDAWAAAGHRVLVVDDNHDAGVSFSMLLRMQGHDVQVVHEGMAALELARSYGPTVVFLDLGMPGMDGYEVARRLRQQPGTSSAVLVALTGWGQEEDRRQTEAAGFDHHLVKPPDLKAVEGLLAELLAVPFS